LCDQEAGGSSLVPKRRRTYIPRERESAEQRLLEDYFGNDEFEPKYPKENFRRMYRMSSTLFNKIVNNILSCDVEPIPDYFTYFKPRHDATGRLSIGPILKCTSAIRQLAYDTAPNAFDEYLQIAERTSRECLDNFTKCKHVLYVEKFLRKPTAADIEKTYQLHEQKHGLPGMLKSIDSWSTFVKTFPVARDEKSLKFKRVQEAARKDIERAFGVLQAKVSHFEILCRVYSIEPTVGLFRCFYVNSKNKGWMSFSKRSDNSSVCYTKPLDSHKQWNDHFFWVDAFACPISFPWNIDKNVSIDPLPKSTEFNVDDYAFLVAHPSLFWKFSEPFFCLVGMSRYYTLDEDTYPGFLHDDREGGCLSLYIGHFVIFDHVSNHLFVYAEMDLSAFIHVVDPTKVKIERVEGEKKLLDSIVGRVVLLLPVALARPKCDLEASVNK
ncbi:putative gypsy type transposase, partial [Tanacetum coccineum]